MTMEFHITIQGKGGHGSRPDLSYNPVDCFAAVYGGLQTIGCTVTEPVSEAMFGPELGIRAGEFLNKLIPLYDYFNQFKV